jgi:hypothetical protein
MSCQYCGVAPVLGPVWHDHIIRLSALTFFISRWRVAEPESKAGSDQIVVMADRNPATGSAFLCHRSSTIAE